MKKKLGFGLILFIVCFSCCHVEAKENIIYDNNSKLSINLDDEYWEEVPLGKEYKYITKEYKSDCGYLTVDAQDIYSQLSEAQRNGLTREEFNYKNLFNTDYYGDYFFNRLSKKFSMLNWEYTDYKYKWIIMRGSTEIEGSLQNFIYYYTINNGYMLTLQYYGNNNIETVDCYLLRNSIFELNLDEMNRDYVVDNSNVKTENTISIILLLAVLMVLIKQIIKRKNDSSSSTAVFIFKMITSLIISFFVSLLIFGIFDLDINKDYYILIIIGLIVTSLICVIFKSNDITNKNINFECNEFLKTQSSFENKMISKKNKKEKKGLSGYTIGIIILALMFISYCGGNESKLYNVGYTEVESAAILAAFMNVLINAFIAGLTPTIIYLANRNLYLKKIKLIYILNWILTIIISVPLYKMIGENENIGMGLLGSFIFSLAVYYILKENYKRKSFKVDFDEEQFASSLDDDLKKIAISKETKCDNCGAIVPGDATECPNCGEEYDDDTDNESYFKNIYDRALSNKKIGNTDQAELEFKKYIDLVEKKIKKIDEKIYSFNNCVEFVISIEQGELEENAIDLNCEISNAYMHLAFMEFDKNNHKEAIKLLNNSLKYNPCNIPAFFELAENYKINKEIQEFYELTIKIYEKIYNIHDLAHYYRNLGYYYTEKGNWDLAKAIYLYSLKYENNQTVTKELAYIIQNTNDNSLPNKEDLTKIFRKNEIPIFIKKDNLNIIKELRKKLEEEGNLDSNVGRFLEDLININANL